jgi:hypothetical protein
MSSTLKCGVCQTVTICPKCVPPAANKFSKSLEYLVHRAATAPPLLFLPFLKCDYKNVKL